MGMATGQVLAAPDLLKLAFYFLPEWLRIALGAAVLFMLLTYGVRKLWRRTAARQTGPARPAK
ncbi:hypothetical protein J7E91_18385 [Streptomyces sp. ISL-99]|uniref:hypothetical protein n=1 Tax=Streptomyces sp. ISL-99 TaxID=2819193 RepID=UPI001BE88094|nr:hypothetical protein [Streptomyces sp. ISL-99]MBT2527334.1 hypothetical protein [Streptomyces sp. ISL-99]